MSKIDHPKYEEFLTTFEDIFGTIPGRNKIIQKEEKKKDYCYDCKSGDVYWHAMVLKCKKCNKFLIGGV